MIIRSNPTAINIFTVVLPFDANIDNIGNFTLIVKNSIVCAETLHTTTTTNIYLSLLILWRILIYFDKLDYSEVLKINFWCWHS